MKILPPTLGKVAVLLLALSIVACSKDSPSNKSPTGPSTTTSPFAGTWAVVFAGDFVGGGNLIIKTDGSYSWIILLTDGVNTATNTVSGNVTTAGSLSGKIYYAGDEIGSISGTFIGSVGSGTWSTVIPTSGTWSATR